MIAFDTLVRPVSDSDPCGPDLDLEGDAQYLNFMVGTEQALPRSYFENTTSTGEVKRFDPKTIDSEAFFATAAPLLARTRDLRLLVLLAKISILARDLASFRHCWMAVATLLEQHWSDVHPRGESGDFAYRAVAIETIDALPTVIFPLQFQMLIVNRRYGEVSFRTVQIAKGEQAPAEGESALDAGLIERIVEDCDLDALRATSAAIAELVETTNRIKKTWTDNTDSPQILGIDRISTTLAAIATWLRGAVESRDPSAASAANPNSETHDPADQPDRDSHVVAGQPSNVGSAAAAAAALQAVADYFLRLEPSSPALLLVRQAQLMVGRSFVEVMRMMVPTHMESAVINIGRDRFFDLPIERMASVTGSSEPTENFAPQVADDEDAPVENVEDGDEPADDTAPQPADIDDAPIQDLPEPATVLPSTRQEFVFNVETRAQALAVLDRVASFFRVSEPSNPIPLLIDKARELAPRDFIALLRDVLPNDALGGLVTKDE